MFYLYADGACQPNPGTGGWAFLLQDINGKEIKFSGCIPDTTNNRMELTAALKGLQYFNIAAPGQPLRILLDSSYVINGMQSWSARWEKRGWTKKNGKPVLNVELWKQIRRELESITSIEYELVAGHSGQRENTICDHLATQEIKKHNAQKR